MILYNVTTKIIPEINDEWLHWMKEKHIPDVMNTGMFLESRICKMLTNQEADGITYAIQYWCKDMETFDRYQNEFAEPLRKEYKEKYEGKYVVFRSLMEEV